MIELKLCQVKSVSGKWVSADPIPGTILVNTGDLLEFWSGGKFPATVRKNGYMKVNVHMLIIMIAYCMACFNFKIASPSIDSGKGNKEKDSSSIYCILCSSR